uniref:Chromosome 15 open reading frame 39 n=1 Tax=Anolis carolinensis TaxID=28377 RepID=A0A803TJ91_ANOCA
MAEKRHLDPMGTVSCSKLPRLMSEPDQHLATDFCKSSVVPNHASESYYGYKGSYFTYPLRYHDGPKPLTHWTPPEAYPHCVAGTASHQLQTETALCMLYKQEAESFERWAGYMGYPGYIPQGWIHSYMAQQSPRAPLAMPKPIYQHHVYNTESGYSLKSSLDLGMVTESALKPLEWALPPSGHLNCTENSGYDTSVSKKAAVAEASFPQLSPRPKDAAMSPGGFSPYRRSFEKCQTGQTASFLEGSYSSMCNSQKHISEMHGNSFGKHSWSKLPPPAGPLAHPPSLMYQDRSCYPLTSYPLLSQEQMYLYHPSYAQAERPNSLPACKRFDSPGTDESPIHPGSYISPTPRSYHPIPMESYPYKRTGTPMTPPGTLLSKEQEHQPRSIAKVAQKSPLPVCAQPHGASREWHKDRGTPEQAKENFPSQQPASQSGTLQKFHSLNRSPGLFGDFAQIQETNSRESFCPSEKAKTREKELSQVPKPSSFSCDAKKKGVDTHKIESGACIIISDSPGTPNNSCCKTTQQALDVQEVLTPSLHNGPQSPQGREKSVIKGPEIPQLPPSPPMPVINNVFSLAPYRDYLEGSSVSLEIPLSKSRENGDGVGTWDNMGLPQLSPNGSVSKNCETGQSEEMKREDGVLDLSCKTETLADNVSHPKGSSKSNGAEVGIVSSNGREVLPETNRPASELPVQSSSEKRGNFQSSATFLFKKFKIRRSPATEVEVSWQNSPRELQSPPNISPPASDKPPEQQSSPGQYFTDLHSSVCTVISCSVSASSPEQLKEWLEKAESEKQVWLAFKDVVALFRKLLSQLDTFLLTHKCPFPHVVRAGAIFIPIHVVKEKLFPNLPGTSVDHVLQNHKVELRPTTLSEEKLLRDLELKSCTSRMLKLLALKQLPDIYPDLLTLHWHNCVKQQLGKCSYFIRDLSAQRYEAIWDTFSCSFFSGGAFIYFICSISTPPFSTLKGTQGNNSMP